MLDQMRHERDIISLEAESGPAALMNAIARLPHFFDTARSVFEKAVRLPAFTFFSNGTLTDVADKANHEAKDNYVRLRSLEAIVPPGLSTDYLTYVNALLPAVKYARNLRNDVLVPYNTWLAKRLGNPQSLGAIHSNLDIAGFKPMDGEQLHKAIDACFAPHGRQEIHTTYGKVVRRNADWSAVQKGMRELNEAFSDAEQGAITAQMNECSDLLAALIKRVEEHPETYKLSGAALTTLSNTAYEVAQHLEYYGVLRFRLIELNKALNDTCTQIYPHM